MKDFENPWPCVVICSRYGGVYEGKAWFAMMRYPEHVPPEAMGDDTSCSEFFYDGAKETTDRQAIRAEEIGRGDTPNEAVEDLKRRLDKEGVKWR